MNIFKTILSKILKRKEQTEKNRTYNDIPVYQPSSYSVRKYPKTPDESFMPPADYSSFNNHSSWNDSPSSDYSSSNDSSSSFGGGESGGGESGGGGAGGDW